MRIAVPYDNGTVCVNFTDTEVFKLYDVVNREIAFTQLVHPTGKNHNVLAGFLADQLVTCLVCNEISSAAQTALDDWGIQLYAGCSGNADERVAELIAGTLKATIQTARSSHHL
jgi:predicted Fe-Mo cluster-binding NifX family protein